ncbi:DJ-1/PfpI family protein [Haloplanus aerogenes]|uniref:DJ-1/PfpI family protein n=1 Tax=Haloplanus aerogenes TaxID=660522 RepID=A0A3M0DYQ6_9EURY|nr:DJ-1/PfpI family protein [Haloplanus aerogenes]AZH25424.1 DJ-1/PfpI family protein [Haloplanus aerogenes]RMB25136.1 DJ-1/PfpI family protein [Haloplanus aerogenes]
MPTTIDILVYDGFDELDAVGPFEAFEMAADAGASLDTSLVTLSAQERVTAAHGLRIDPDGTLSVDDPPDVVVVPGGGWNDRRPEGAWAEAEKGAIPDALARLHDAGTTLAAVCTGGMLLSRAGVLSGRPAVTHGGALDDLRATDADVVDARVVDDGDVLTAGGITSGLDLALHLIERLADAETAESVATDLEYTPQRDRWVS